MTDEGKRVIIELNDKDIEKYCFILTDEINNEKYKVKYQPIVVYEKDEYIYGIFTNFKKDEKDNLYIVNCRYPKSHLHNFTVEYKLPAKEIEFLEEQKENKEVKETIYRYKRLYNRVYKDYNRIIELNKQVTKTDDKEELKNMLEEYTKIKESINSYNSLKLQMLLNWNLSKEKLVGLIDQSINLITLKLNKKKEDFKAILILIVIIIFIIGLVRSCANNDDTSSSGGSGYSTKCYTRSDGKRCCISCKKTSYGDVGCSRSCN